MIFIKPRFFISFKFNLYFLFVSLAPISYYILLKLYNKKESVGIQKSRLIVLSFKNFGNDGTILTIIVANYQNSNCSAKKYTNSNYQTSLVI